MDIPHSTTLLLASVLIMFFLRYKKTGPLHKKMLGDGIAIYWKAAEYWL